MISRFFKKLFTLVVVISIGVGLYNYFKQPPAGASVAGPTHTIPADSITFLGDRTYVDEAGDRISQQEIFDEVFQMIEKAEKFVLIDMFLFNDFQGKNPETQRSLSGELTSALIQKKNKMPRISLVVVTDPINEVYGGDSADHLRDLREAGVDVVVTDLTALRDSNPIYSSVWRTLFSWFGNSPYAGRLPHPFSSEREKVTVRTYLRLFNFNANHRKLIVTDETKTDGKVKLVTLITSANPHDGSSAHSNVALKVEDWIWKDVITSERAVAGFSGEQFGPAPEKEITDEMGDVSMQFLTESKIRDQLVTIIDSTVADDEIEVMMFYLSERKVMKALWEAAKRDVLVRVILDPNKDAFGHKKNGIPNRPVASELIDKSGGRIRVRWCDTHGEQCHSKMVLVRNKDNYYLFLGSANLTRRNIADYNLETDVMLSHKGLITATRHAYDYFNDFWNNAEGRIYTADYEKYKDDSLLKMVLYQIMERLGTSSF